MRSAGIVVVTVVAAVVGAGVVVAAGVVAVMTGRRGATVLVMSGISEATADLS